MLLLLLQYTAHLQEILLTIQNEYTDWTEVAADPQRTKELVSRATIISFGCGGDGCIS